MKIHNLSNNPLFLVILSFALFSCNGKKETKGDDVGQEQPGPEAPPPYGGDLPLEGLTLPEGFSVDVYAEHLDGARSMALGDDGTLFVGTRNEGKVYALKDEDGDYRADQVYEVATDLEQPNGVAFRDGALYVAAVSRLFKYPNIEQQLSDPPDPELTYEDFPNEFQHGWKYIAFGARGKLYVPVGAPCNICDRTDEDERFATISRMDPDGGNREIIAHGVRNTVGFTWHPQSG